MPDFKEGDIVALIDNPDYGGTPFVVVPWGGNFPQSPREYWLRPLLPNPNLTKDVLDVGGYACGYRLMLLESADD